MNKLKVPRLVISGPQSSRHIGRFAMALCFALRKEGVSVSAVVVGSDLQLAAHLRNLCGRYVPCVDSNVLSESEILTNLFLAGLGSDFLMIVGEKSLYEGVAAARITGSPARIAEISKSPVVMVYDGMTVGNSTGAMFKGFLDLGKKLNFAGLIPFVRHKNQTQVEYLQACVKGLPLPPVLGYVDAAEAATHRRVTGYFEKRELLEYSEMLNLAEELKNTLDFDDLRKIASASPEIDIPAFTTSPAMPKTVIAVAEDACFGIGYQENFELLRYLGAQIVKFSPLTDASLPVGVGAIYLSGGYLSDYSEVLEKNAKIRSSIKEFVQSGGLVLAESGGAAFLCSKFEVDEHGKCIDGVGVINGTARVTKAPVRYGRAVMSVDGILGAVGQVVSYYHCGFWKLPNLSQDYMADNQSFQPALTDESRQESVVGYYSENRRIFCSSAFLNFGSLRTLSDNVIRWSSKIYSFKA